MDELKPCPFCGKSNLRIVSEHIERAQGYGYWSYSVCHEATIRQDCTGSASGPSEEAAVAAWNRRAAASLGQEAKHG